MKWSTTQNTAIFQRDKNILVSAAAGSGKTAVLVERIKQLIIKDGVSIDRMLIVTFTKSAAAEMKERVQQAILKELEHETHGPQESDMALFLRQQLYRVEDANISTFHSFCTKIIRRYFYVVEIDPNLKVCDEYQKAIVWEAAMNDLMDEKFQSEDEGFINFLKAYANKKDENQLKDIIKNLYHEMMSMPDPFKWLKEKTEQLNSQHETHGLYIEAISQTLKNEILDQLNRMIEVETQLIEYSVELGLEKYSVNEASNLTKLSELALMFETDLDQGLVALSQFAFTRSTPIKANTVEPEEKNKLDHLKSKRTQLLKKELQEKYGGSTREEALSLLEKTYIQVKVLEGLLLDFHKLYGHKKRERGWMDFNDLEHFALAILENEQVAAEYKRHFEHIFIDEYQDSNLIQEALIEKISRNNNLFMVGDVKQSIYRFRLADPTIFIKKYDTYAQNKEDQALKLDLNKNYRSKKNIIEVTNHVFSNIMSEKNGEMVYTDDHALYLGVSYPTEYDYPVEMNLIDYDVKVAMEEGPESLEAIDEEISEMKKAEVEGAIIGNLIKENYGIDLYDCKLGCVRKAKYKDMVLIFRTKKNWMNIIYEKLNEVDIPAYMDEGDTYFEAIEVNLFLDLLRVIDNRQQDIPLLALMRGPVFSFTTDELLEIRLSNKKVSYYEAFQTYLESGGNEALKLKMNQLMNRLDLWREKSTYMKLEELIDYLYEDSGILNYIMALPKGREREGNFRLLLDKAFSFNQMTTKSLFNFIKYMEQLKDSDAKISPRKIPGEEEDVVRLMTIHGSKGLEFPIVILGGLGKNFNIKTNQSKITLHKELGIGLGYVDYKGHIKAKTLLQKLIESRRRRESRSEDMRVLYVALTRAVDKLILIGTVDKGGERLDDYKASSNKIDVESGRSFMDWLAPLVINNPQVTFCEKSATEELMKSHVKKNSHGEAHQYLQETIKKGISEGNEIKLSSNTPEYEAVKCHIDTYLNWNYDQMESTKTPSKYTVSELNHLLINEATAYSIQEKYGSEKSTEIQIPIKSMDKELHKKKGPSTFSNAEKGSILHKVMYFLNDKKAHEAPYIKNKLTYLVEKGCLTPLERNVIDEKAIQKFYLSPLGQRLVAGLNVEKEKSFNLLMDAHHKFKPAEIKGEILIQGTIDCYFKEASGVVVVDYKTDFILNKENPEQEIKAIVERYKSQLELYKEAIESIQGEKVAEMYLYLFNINKAVKL